MAGNVNLTMQQMQMAIAVLLNSFQFPPNPYAGGSTPFLGPDGMIQFPDNALNESLGQNINAFTDSTNIHLGVAGAGPAAFM